MMIMMMTTTTKRLQNTAVLGTANILRSEKKTHAPYTVTTAWLQHYTP